MYVRVGPFMDYCKKRQYDCNRVLNDLAANKFITHKSIRKRMRAEPNTYSNPVFCFVIPVKATSPIAVPNVPEGKSRRIVELKRPQT
jgi:hypothetical protein